MTDRGPSLGRAVNSSYRPGDLSALEQLRAGHLTRRFVQLFIGLILYGWTMAMLVQANLGLDPWDVFHQGVAQHLNLSFGQIVIVTGAVVLIGWFPLRQKPGVGTVANVIVIGLAADLGISIMSQPELMRWRIVMMAGGIIGNGLAGALYIGAHLGTGPRDGLWVGLVRTVGYSVRMWRTVIEISVLAIGFALGGTIGAGTVLYALAIGPVVQFFLPRVNAPIRWHGPDPAQGSAPGSNQ